MKPVMRGLLEDVERLSILDPASEALQSAVRSAVPQDSRLKDLLSGTWLGHPAHPPLTDVVIGCWLSAAVLDLLGGKAAKASERLIGLGSLAAVPTVAAGLSDWAELHGDTRRVGSVHAITNSTALTLFGLSWMERQRGRRQRGVALSLLGSCVVMFSAWLGGHLSFGKGVGVSQAVFEELPTEWVPLMRDAEVEEGQPVGAEWNGTGILLVRHGGRVHALLDRCTHRGCALHEGTLNDGLIVCPCHGSAFDLHGRLRKGPATAPEPRLDVRIEGEMIEVRERA